MGSVRDLALTGREICRLIWSEAISVFTFLGNGVVNSVTTYWTYTKNQPGTSFVTTSIAFGFIYGMTYDSALRRLVLFVVEKFAEEFMKTWEEDKLKEKKRQNENVEEENEDKEGSSEE